MALLQAIIAAVIHSLGRILNTIFGWATAMLFGRVDEKQQMLMSIASFGSVLWLLAIIGIIWPSAGMWLATSVVPPNVARYREWIRLGMLLAAALIPFVVGACLLFIGQRADNTFKSKAKEVLSGWPYTVGLAVTMLLMSVLAPLLKLQVLKKRWTSQHIAILVPPGHYLDALHDLEVVLAEQGYQPAGRAASWMLRIPTKVLSWFAKNQTSKLLAEKLTVLEEKHFEIMLHPSDLIISGPAAQVTLLRSLLVEKLAFTRIRMTWTPRANEMEERMRKLWLRINAAENAVYETLLPDLLEIESDLHSAKLSYEEWEVLFRQKLQIEHALFMIENTQLRKAG